MMFGKCSTFEKTVTQAPSYTQQPAAPQSISSRTIINLLLGAAAIKGSSEFSTDDVWVGAVFEHQFYAEIRSLGRGIIQWGVSMQEFRVE